MSIVYDIERRILIGDGVPGGDRSLPCFESRKWFDRPSVRFHDPHVIDMGGSIVAFDPSVAPYRWEGEGYVSLVDVPADETSVDRLARHYSEALATLPEAA